MSKHHILKTIQPYYNDVISGKKKFELRKDDRYFEVGYILELLEYDPYLIANGRNSNYIIDYVLRDAPQFGLMEGYCILSLTPI